MPAGDRTGPGGMGPRTGRGAGFCAGYDSPGYANGGFYGGFGGRGFGRRPFGGRGFRRMRNPFGYRGQTWYGAYPNAYPPAAPMTAEQEQEALKDEETWLQEQLDSVRSRLNKKEK